MTYAEALSDDCTCKWVNYSDHGGWYLKGRDPKCPIHGKAGDDE